MKKKPGFQIGVENRRMVNIPNFRPEKNQHHKHITINNVVVNASTVKHLLDTAAILNLHLTTEDYIKIINADPETYHNLPEDVKLNPEIELAYKLS